MRFPLFLASAAALSLVSCSNGPADNAGNGQAASRPSLQISDKALEDQVMAALEDAINIDGEIETLPPPMRDLDAIERRYPALRHVL